MASFKQLFSAAPAKAYDELMSGPRLAFYGFLMFAPGCMTWLYLEDVKKEMEQENEAARLVILAKARAEVEAEEVKEAQKKAELDAVIAKIDSIQSRLQAMEHVVLGTPLPEAIEQSNETKESNEEHVNEEEKRIQKNNWNVAAVWVRLREIWDEEDEFSWEDLMSIESWKSAWNEFYRKLFDDKDKFAYIKADELRQVLNNVTTPGPLRKNREDIRAAIKSMIHQEERNDESIGNIVENAKNLWQELWKDDEPSQPEPIDPLEAKVLAKLHRSDIAKRKQSQEQQFQAYDIRGARESRGQS
ncbi:hypothetical protein THRCLA_09524 [Thraustotheca clavata]|uniref:Uncharacterized protein n=1 Tax=Thraustotheca clavata TaxID=74557 RepID=A0A1V9YVZ0_9STRA|nr:hypothetical protein THRCLA_09524 [Thraustotheca clavata]